MLPGGYLFGITDSKGNTRLSDAKKEAIINAIESSWTYLVGQTEKGLIMRKLLSGNTEYLKRDKESGKYYFE